MAADITMPRLTDSMEEGVVAKWHVEVGSAVERGQLLADIDTDKATIEFEAEMAGTILAILVGEGETASIGAPIARLGDPGEAVEESDSQEPVPDASAPDAPDATRAARPSERGSPAGARANASPVARRLAEQLGVDLSEVRGSGPGGLISKEDVRQAADGRRDAEGASALRGDVQVQQPTRVQHVIARRMVEGASAPDFAVESEIDMTAVVRLRAALGRADEPAPSLNDFVVKAAARALRDFPRLNAAYTEHGFELFSRINVGIAVATDDALVVPTIFDADTKPLSSIAAESHDLAERVRRGTVSPAELDGGTFTVTNLGMFGATRFLPIINPPQAAILAVGAVTKRPVVDEEGNVVARDLVNATLVCDHRIAYGVDAARFLARLRELLGDPEQLATPEGVAS